MSQQTGRGIQNIEILEKSDINWALFSIQTPYKISSVSSVEEKVLMVDKGEREHF